MEKDLMRKIFCSQKMPHSMPGSFRQAEKKNNKLLLWFAAKRGQVCTVTVRSDARAFAASVNSYGAAVTAVRQSFFAASMLAARRVLAWPAER